jgi:hypothetical protein
LLRDVLRADDSLACPLQVITASAPDVLVLTQFDFDLDGLALAALTRTLKARGTDLPYAFSLQTNAGRPSGIDLTGDGEDDDFGFGWFEGQGGMAILSRWPIALHADLTETLWADLPGALWEADDGDAARTRLSSDGHWSVIVEAPEPFELLAFHATAPVFDGPEDRNGRRNADEARLWLAYLDDALPQRPSGRPKVLAGQANLDPNKGEGRPTALQALLAHPALQDPQPAGELGLATVNWPDPVPGDLRVGYVLPSSQFAVLGSGVWSAEGDCAADTAAAHRLVWVDVTLR